MIKESDSLKLPLRYKVTSHNGIEIHEASEYKPNVFTLVCSIKGCHISIVQLFIQAVNSHKGLLEALKLAEKVLSITVAEEGTEYDQMLREAQVKTEQAIAAAKGE